MEEESTSILLNNTFSTLNSREAWQLQVKPIGSTWVYKTKHNPDGSTWYKAQLVIKGYEQMDFGETYAPVGKLTTFRYLISLIRRYGWNMDLLDVVTTFLNPEIDDDDIYMTLPEGWPEGWPEGSNAPKIVVRLRKALYGLKQAPWLWHESRRYQCLSTLSWVHTVLCRSQPLSPQRWYSDTSVCRRYLHVICGGCHQSRNRSQRKTLREVQDDEPRPGTPIPRHRDVPR